MYTILNYVILLSLFILLIKTGERKYNLAMLVQFAIVEVISFAQISVIGFNVNREIYRHVSSHNKKILVLSIVLSLSLLLRAVNDIILVTLDAYFVSF